MSIGTSSLCLIERVGLHFGIDLAVSMLRDTGQLYQSASRDGSWYQQRSFYPEHAPFMQYLGGIRCWLCARGIKTECYVYVWVW